MKKLTNIWYPAVIGAASFIPLLSLAQPNSKEINDRLNAVISTLNIIIGILFIVATVVFLWGMVMYIANSADEGKREKAKGIMTWGIIGLAIMAVAWGITQILVSYFGVPNKPPSFVVPPSGPGAPQG